MSEEKKATQQQVNENITFHNLKGHTETAIDKNLQGSQKPIAENPPPSPPEKPVESSPGSKK